MGLAELSMVSKDVIVATAARRVQPRKRDGKYASHANDLHITRIKPRRNPTSALVVLRGGGGGGKSPLKKSDLPETITKAAASGGAIRGTKMPAEPKAAGGAAPAAAPAPKAPKAVAPAMARSRTGVGPAPLPKPTLSAMAPKPAPAPA